MNSYFVKNCVLTFTIFTLLFLGKTLFNKYNSSLEIAEKQNQLIASPTNNEQEIVKPKEEVVYNGSYYAKKNILIVNDQYLLDKNYNPGVNQEANEAFLKMQKDATAQKIYFEAISIFRSYSEQEKLFNMYKSNDENAENYSAKPGESEHQTGLAFDVINNQPKTNLQISFGQTAEGKWIKENAPKYGFIIRYPLGKEEITKKQYEPWHLRYVGIEHAIAISNQNITLEEYLELV